MKELEQLIGKPVTPDLIYQIKSMVLEESKRHGLNITMDDLIVDTVDNTIKGTVTVPFHIAIGMMGGIETGPGPVDTTLTVNNEDNNETGTPTDI